MVTADHTSMYEIKDLEEYILKYVLYIILNYGKAKYFHIIMNSNLIYKTNINTI
jgi:hypothetical protein